MAVPEIFPVLNAEHEHQSVPEVFLVLNGEHKFQSGSAGHQELSEPSQGQATNATQLTLLEGCMLAWLLIGHALDTLQSLWRIGLSPI